MLIINFREFQADKEDWASYYTERLSHYFVANDIPEDKHKAVLLSICRAETYQLICNLLAPDVPTKRTVTYEYIVQLVEKHKNPKPSIIIQRLSYLLPEGGATLC
jgi:hypothetical protein